jgi:hypothetical protein
MFSAPMVVLTGGVFLRTQGLWARASRDQAGGVLTSAAVPRAGLGPATPPLCRCGEHTAGLIQRWWSIPIRCTSTMFAAPVLGLIGAATSRRSPKGGGQSRSQSTLAPGRTQLKTAYSK